MSDGHYATNPLCIAAVQATSKQKLRELLKKFAAEENGQDGSVLVSMSLLRELLDTDAKVAAKQAQLDHVMLEHCPKEMTPEQMVNWAAHQKPVSDDVSKQVDAALGIVR